MKKIYLLLLPFFFSLNSHSQEFFEGTFPPTGWAVFDNGVGANNWNVVATPCQGIQSANILRENIGQGNTSEDYLAMPLTTIPANGQLRFTGRSGIAGPNGTIYEIRVKIGSAGAQNDPTGYTTLQTYTEVDMPVTCTDFTVNGLGAYAGIPVYVAFVKIFTQPTAGIAGDRWLIDSVQIVAQCFPPTGLAATPLATTASLNWTGTGTSYEIENLLAATPPTGIPTGTSTTNSFNQTGLSPNTDYCYYVREVCGPGNASTWAGPFCYTTTTAPPVCGGTFFDSGGPAGNYGNDENTTITILPTTPGDIVTVIFNNFNTQAGSDILFIYQGTSAIPPNLINTYSGTVNPGTIISTHPTGALTFVFVSNGTTTQAGWNATVTCGPPPTCTPPTQLTTTDVLATSATLAWTQNPNPDTTIATNWEVIAVPCGQAPPATGWTATTTNPHIFNGLNPVTCYDLYVRAICSPTNTSPNAGPRSITTTTLPPVCGGNFVDTGGPNGQYQNSENYTVNIIPGPTELVTVTFTQFATEACCDFMRIYRGTVIDPAFLIGQFQGANSPGEVTSTLPGEALTFVWVSDGSVLAAGWLANITCGPAPECPKPTALSTNNLLSTSVDLAWTNNSSATTFHVLALPCGSPLPGPTTTGWVTTTLNPFNVTGLSPDTCYTLYVRAECAGGVIDGGWSAGINVTTQQVPPACGGIFSDSGGVSGQYQNGEDFTITICADPGEFLIIDFTAFGTENCCDHLLVYNGPSTASPLIGSFQGTVSPGLLISSDPGGCFTFVWSSDGSVVGLGWAANIICATCILPTNLTVTNTNIYDVTLSWTNIGTPTSWQVIALPCGSPAPTATTTGWLTSTTTTFTYPGLDPSTCYDFYVRKACSDTDISPWAGPATTTTLPTCPQPIDLVNMGTTTDSVTIGWTPVGPATLFEVVVQAVGAGIPTTPGIITSTNPLTVNGLSVGFYEFYIRAICSATDQSTWSGPVNFYVPAALQACAGVDVQLDTTTPGVLNLCPGLNCVDLTATYLDTGNTSTYNVASIPFTPPFPFTGGTQTSVNIDDRWSSVIDLPFNFCFFGENQTRALVGSNGVISFDIQGFGGTQVPEGGCAWAYTQTIPDPAFPIRKAIYGPYQDIDPSINNAVGDPDINYQILGVAPCRVFVVNFSQVAQFSGACNADPIVGAQTSQVVLYETSNIIDVYVQRRVPCNSWNGGRAVIGIQNLAGTQAHFPPNRNTGNWTANNEAWRFTPAGASNVTFGWYQGSTLISNNTTINFCTDETTTITAQAIYTACGGEQTITTAPVLLQILEELPVQPDVEACDQYVLPALNLGSYFSQPGGVGPIAAGTAITSSQTIYVQATVTSSIGTCTLGNSFDVTIVDEIVPTFDTIPALCLNDTNPPSLPSVSNNATPVPGTWSPATIDTSILGTTPYTFTPFGANLCAVPTTINIVVNAPVQSNFNLLNTYCQNTTPADLPLTSENLFAGTWFPSTINTSNVGVSNYVFTPNPGQCALPYTLSVTINEAGAASVTDFSYTTPVCATGNATPIPVAGFTTGGVYSCPDPNLSLNPSTGVIDLTASIPGNYTVSYSVAASLCLTQSTSTANITINPLVTPVTNFSYTSPVCANGTNPTPIPGTGFTVGGTYSCPNTDLTLNATTGEIDLVSSLPGTYTVTYTVNADTSLCLLTNNSTAEITINPIITPVTGFSYTSPVCDDGANLTPIPVPGFTAGGVFSCPDMNLVIDATTGEINLVNSLPGTYTITYTVNADSSICLVSNNSSTSLTITPIITPVTNFSYTSPVCQDGVNPTPIPVAGFTTGGVYSCPDGNLVLNPITGEITLNASQPGNYTVTYTVNADLTTCQVSNSSTANVIINPVITPVTNFSYTSPLCNNVANPLPILAPGFTLGGVYSCPDTNLALNTNTGEINLGASQPGTYVVTYTVSANASLCQLSNSSNATITINPGINPVTIFSYTSPVCANGVNPSPIPATGFTNGGVYAGATGLTLNPTTGEINLGSSTPGTYNVTYTVNADASICQAASTSTAQIIIDPIINAVTGFSYESPLCFSDPDPLPIKVNNFSEGGTFSISDGLIINPITGLVTLQNVAAGTYTITYTIPDNTTTCFIGGTSQAILEIGNCEIPKGISINNDGNNDTFDLAGFDVKYLEIYNRYGLKVFSKSNYKDEWHGQSDKGEELPDGTYYYMIERDGQESLTGWVYINRKQ